MKVARELGVPTDTPATREQKEEARAEIERICHSLDQQVVRSRSSHPGSGPYGPSQAGPSRLEGRFPDSSV